MNIIKKQSTGFIIILAFSLLISGCGSAPASESLLPSSGNPSGSNPSPSLFPPAVPPPAPIITTANAFADRVELDWSDTSTQEDGFIIERDGIQIAQTARNISAWIDTTVQPGTTYCYAVRSYNPVGQSAASLQKCATVPMPPITKWILPKGAQVRSLAVNQATGELYAVGEIAVNAPNNILDNNGIIAKFNPDGTQACAKQWGTDTWDVVFDIAMYNGEAYVSWNDIAGNGTVSIFNDACVEVRSLDIGHISAVQIAVGQSGIYFNNGIKIDFYGATIYQTPPSLPRYQYSFYDVAEHDGIIYYTGVSLLPGDLEYMAYIAALDNTVSNVIWMSRWEKYDLTYYRIIAGAYGVYTVNNDLKVTHHDLGGNLLWTYQDVAQLGTFVNDIVADNDAVYVIGSHDLVKINAADGTVAWRTTIITAFDFDYLALFNNVLYVAKGHTNMILRYNTLTGESL